MVQNATSEKTGQSGQKETGRGTQPIAPRRAMDQRGGRGKKIVNEDTVEELYKQCTSLDRTPFRTADRSGSPSHDNRGDAAHSLHGSHEAKEIGYDGDNGPPGHIKVKKNWELVAQGARGTPATWRRVDRDGRSSSSLHLSRRTGSAEGQMGTRPNSDGSLKM
ncbi:17331_t:CDS:2 [Acaulospora colombiana]|uniref:17331_t:CDS:1 n=1 Tax=Acaulospora colombiana TaxID=27376 RepID=A0ACA9NDM2_9GLOM|nr:17331_t:CDS:2 [Acaulospora colombiana]